MSIFLDYPGTEPVLAIKRPLCGFEAVSPYLQSGSVFPRLKISFVVLHLNKNKFWGCQYTSATGGQRLPPK